MLEYIARNHIEENSFHYCILNFVLTRIIFCVIAVILKQSSQDEKLCKEIEGVGNRHYVKEVLK